MRTSLVPKDVDRPCVWAGSERRLLERALAAKHLAFREAFEELEKRDVEPTRVPSRPAPAPKNAALVAVQSRGHEGRLSGARYMVSLRPGEVQ